MQYFSFLTLIKAMTLAGCHIIWLLTPRTEQLKGQKQQQQQGTTLRTRKRFFEKSCVYKKQI